MLKGHHIKWTSFGKTFGVLGFIILQINLFAGKSYLSQPSDTHKTDSLEIKKAMVFLGKARYFMEARKYDSAEWYARKAILSARITNSYFILAKATQYFGNTKSRRGDYDMALRYQTEARRYFRALGKKKEEAQLTFNIGRSYQLKNDFYYALTYHLEAYKKKKSINDLKALARISDGLGEIYAQLHDTANALKYDIEALRIRQKLKDSIGINTQYIAIGLDLIDGKTNKKSTWYFEKAYTLAKQVGDTFNIGEAGLRVADMNLFHGNYAEAKKGYEAALLVGQKIGELRMEALGYAGAGKAAYKLGLDRVAIEYLNTAFNIAEEIRSAEIKFNASELLAELYEKHRDYDQATKFFKIKKKTDLELIDIDLVREETIKNLSIQHRNEEFLKAKERETQALISETERQRRDLTLGVAFLLILIIGGFSIYLNRKLAIGKRQKHKIEEQSKEMIASIRYAKTIQDAFLPSDEALKKLFNDLFTLYQPKNIVSGDFYWTTTKEDYTYLAVCDCTGHGVPGAVLSLLCNHYLTEAVDAKRLREPGEILDFVRLQLIKNLEGGRDGMDAVLLRIPVHRGDVFTVSYASANGNVILLSKGEVMKLEKNQMPVGRGENNSLFSTYKISYSKNDKLYMFTDGFADQFGGDRGKKFMSKNLRALLAKNSDLPMPEQKLELLREFLAWKATLEQTDDVTVLGLEV